MALIHTTQGVKEESDLARTVGFEDRPHEFVIWVEWKIGEELVRRDCLVSLKATLYPAVESASGGL